MGFPHEDNKHEIEKLKKAIELMKKKHDKQQKLINVLIQQFRKSNDASFINSVNAICKDT